MYYEDMSMQYREIFFNSKNMKIFSCKFFIFFLIFAQNRDSGYALELPRQLVPTIFVLEQKYEK